MERLAVNIRRSPVTKQDVHPQQMVHLLWTGGWDSTYRALDLVLIHGIPVQPWYVIDKERVSTPKEIAVMEAIRKAAVARDPEVEALLRPTRFVELDAIGPEPDLTAMYRQLQLGSQYDWLSRLARQQGLSHLELSVERRDSRVHRMLWENTERVRSAGGDTFRLKPYLTDSNLELFRNFEFPILHLTKRDFHAIAQESGFLDLMLMTWYCHSPRNGHPCGACTPCLIAIGEGMGRDISRLRRAWGRLRLIKNSLVSGRSSSQ